MHICPKCRYRSLVQIGNKLHCMNCEYSRTNVMATTNAEIVRRIPPKPSFSQNTRKVPLPLSTKHTPFGSNFVSPSNGTSNGEQKINGLIRYLILILIFIMVIISIIGVGLEEFLNSFFA